MTSVLVLETDVRYMSNVPKVVVFDCDGVLVDSVSSWKTLHDYFGTDNSHNLTRFINGELTLSLIHI